MKTVVISVATLVAVIVPAAGNYLRSGRRAGGVRTNVKPPSSINVVKHEKDPGEGYQKGSPLYEKQQRWLASKKSRTTANATEKEKSEPTGGFNQKQEHWLKTKMPWLYMLVKINEGSTQPMTYKDWAMQPYRSIRSFGFYVFSCTAYVILLLLVASVYRYSKSGQSLLLVHKEELIAEEDWAYGLCTCKDCGKDWPICCMAVFFPAIRLADTMSNPKAKVFNFWPMLLILLGLGVAGQITGGATWLMLTIFVIWFRQRLRMVFNHSPHTPKTICIDTFLWCCCLQCCAAIQEAREVEKVRKPSAFH